MILKHFSSLWTDFIKTILQFRVTLYNTCFIIWILSGSQIGWLAWDLIICFEYISLEPSNVMFICLIDPSLCFKCMLCWAQSSDGWPVKARLNFLLKLTDLFRFQNDLDPASWIKEHLCSAVLWRTADITRTVTETVKQAENFSLNPNSLLKLVLISSCLDSFQQNKALAVEHLSYMAIFVSL